MFTNLKRVSQFAITDFSRNKGISLAAIFILVVTILFITGLFFLHGASDFLIDTVRNKIDITAYFKSDTPEDQILAIKDQISESSPGIQNIQYVSKEDALNNFTQKHQDNATFSNALAQLGDNPFLPSLNITTTGDSSQYEKIAGVLESEQYAALIDKVDFSQKKDTIERVFAITSKINTFGLGLAVILVLVVILVVFNTIKLAIDNKKEEIITMRIVGASSWFVRAPFVIQGVIFGVISFFICFFATLLLTYFLTSGVSVIMPGFSMAHYLISNLWIIILIQLAFGVALGVISSLIAVNKYLKV